jgi:alpha-L-arabinofuranosidase/beta-xylosidase
MTFWSVSGVWAQHSGKRKVVAPTLTVQVDQKGKEASPHLFGVFFEDINLSSDGGLHPELVRDLSFEDPEPLKYWELKLPASVGRDADNGQGKLTAKVLEANYQAKPPLPPINPMNRKFLQIQTEQGFRLINRGYWGMPFQKDKKYTVQLYIRSSFEQQFEGPCWVRLKSESGEVLGETSVGELGVTWQKKQWVLTAKGNTKVGYLEIEGIGKGACYLDMVSVKPEDTWKNNGLRKDLAEAVAALKPKFFRFPGGCWVEGEELGKMYQWKKTIGLLEQRTPMWNIWGYQSTHALGYLEYLKMAEDLRAEPIFCINAGMSHQEVVPMEQMGQWVQDALDAIEYANGGPETVWGALRIKHGHARPFGLKYVEIGNENGQEPYAQRWKLMAEAIKKRYPEIILIANEWAGGHPSDPQPAIIDEHYYNNPDWFIWNAHYYDRYPRGGSKIFVGEYAVTSNGGNGNLRAAIGEAAWMIGLERNSDVVAMASYAPLFCHTQHKAWPINLINFDATRWYGIPGYYVQKLFAEHQGTHQLNSSLNGSPKLSPPYHSGNFGLGTWNNTAEFKDIVVFDTTGKEIFRPVLTEDISKWRKTGAGNWTVEGGVLRQSAIATQVTLFMGDTTWRDYTITLKARKTSGENGFQIYFRNGNNTERTRWDLGGYGNTIHLLDMGVVTKSIPAEIETGVWYEVRLEIKGARVRGYLNGKLIQEVNDENSSVNAIHTSSVVDEKSGDVILKLVNTSPQAVNLNVILEGINKSFSPSVTERGNRSATVYTLTGSSPLAENSLDEPTKVAPKATTILLKQDRFQQYLPAHSLVVVRIHSSAAKNPIMYTDVPDMSMIRVGKNYYMSSTTMHMTPGIPIMKSQDLVNWSLVGYAYDTLSGKNDQLNLQNGKNTYGKGTWASSLRYHKGVYYLSSFAQTTGLTYLYTTRDIERGPWKRAAFRPMMHDHSLHFEEDGRIFMVYGSGQIRLVELQPDLSGVKPGTERVLIENAGLPALKNGQKGGLPAEGSQLFKINGYYYLFHISWPAGGMRTVIVHRSKTLMGPYEGRVVLQHQGIAQGGLIQHTDGRWFSYLFQDRGAVGRIPFMVPVRWEEDWPVLGEAGKVPDLLDLPASKGLMPGVVASDEFDYTSTDKEKKTGLNVVWQWNHQPEASGWSVTEKPGFLLLKAVSVESNLEQVKNILTQRTFGPQSNAIIKINVLSLQEGDVAGLSLFQKKYGWIGVKKQEGKLLLCTQDSSDVAEEIPVGVTDLYLKASADFEKGKDEGYFFYSWDGVNWYNKGKPLKMTYSLAHFMGYRFALFHMATKELGGHVEIDYFRISEGL